MSGPELKSHERVKLFGEQQLAEYLPTHTKGSKVLTGWMLRLEIGDSAIEAWGTTQDEALELFNETLKQWLKDTNKRPVIA